MSVNKCRVCGNDLFKDPLLLYENMPKSAQFLPGKSELQSDKGTHMEVCQCTGCGLVQLSNEPVSYYREVIRASAFSGEMGVFREKQFGEFIKKYGLKNKKVFEVGCGRGEYLSIMQKLGVEAFGLEASNDAVLKCVGGGLKVSKGFIESSEQKLENAPFDAFYILNFLEHLPDPNSLLKGIHKNLADGAVGLIEVPNFDMILRKDLFSEFISDHLTYFTKETLKIALQLNGFDVIECSEIWYDYIISAVVRKRSVMDLSRFHDQQARLKKELDEYIGSFGNGRVAIWGAGHQALALIALAGLGGKIKYVVDSASFKQGKFTPAVHIPIVSPDMLDADPVDAVIVMAAGYSDEVVKTIRQKFDNKIKISILRESGLEKKE